MVLHFGPWLSFIILLRSYLAWCVLFSVTYFAGIDEGIDEQVEFGCILKLGYKIFVVNLA
jgi:hypothetical protein